MFHSLVFLTTQWMAMWKKRSSDIRLKLKRDNQLKYFFKAASEGKMLRKRQFGNKI